MVSSPVAEPKNEDSVTQTQSGSNPQPQQQQQQPQSQLQEESKIADSNAAGAANNNEDASQKPGSLSGDSATTAAGTPKWPGWPGDNVFRLIVPVLKVGSIIGRKGELVKKMCEETRARIRILEGPVGMADRIVLISGKEDPDAQLSPAMDAVLKVFKRVSGLFGEADESAAGAGFCSVRLLVASSQATHLIGKQGSTIKSISEISSASIRVLSQEEGPSFATSDERVVEIHGEASKVLKALEGVLGQLRKFLVDHSVIYVFERTFHATISQDRASESWADKTQSSLHHAPAAAPAQAAMGSEFPLSLKRDPSLFDREAQFDSKIPQSGLSLYGQDPGLGGLRSTGFGRTAAPIVTQMTKTMQVPLSYAEDIIGIGGVTIAYIRRTSGAILTVQESRGLPDEITVEIKGTSSQVEAAEQLIQEFANGRKDPVPSVYGNTDTGLSSYSHLADSSYRSSSFSSQPMGGYGSSSYGGYGSYRF